MSDTITRLNAALEGRYAIERELGEGGMATVYLADDLKHERKVALKVLKPELAAVVGGERFLAEIKTTANLQHPHILPLFDSGEADGVVFYVMPYVQGESLRERLDREKQLGVEDALAITQKVANALDYAHTNGVVHRDIKPGNILLSAQGEPLIADFGIALAVAQAGAGRITETGLSLGTPHYMSPEQATGDRDVDPRSDVYALGCVLYEMLAGQPPFSASTAQAVLVKILTADPPSITSERRTVPPHVGAALAKALEKLPADRFTSAADFATALTDPSFTYEARQRTSVAASTPEPVATPLAAPLPGPWNRLTVAFATTTALLAALAAWGWLAPTAEPAPPTRALVDLGDLVLRDSDEVIVSPDGSRFAVTGGIGGQSALYWRDASEESFRMIPETTGAWEPAFSPDGDWIVYSDGRDALLKVSLSGGAPTPVLPSSSNLILTSSHWGDDGMIVFQRPVGHVQGAGYGRRARASPPTGPTLSVSVATGRRQGRAGCQARWQRVMLLDLETDSVRELIPGGLDPKYVETGHILYADASGGLWAQPFDAGRLEMTGGAVPVLDGLSVVGDYYARYSVSRNGTLVYGAGASGGSAGAFRLLIVDLEGNAEPLGLTPRDFNDVRWSPDGRSVVYRSGGGPQLYTYDVEVETAPRQLTFVGANAFPVFSPDGTRVAFTSQRDGTDGFDLFVKTLDDDEPATSIIPLPGNQRVGQWPSDTLIVFEHNPGGVADLWMLDLSDPDSAVAVEYLSSEARLLDIRASPDGTLAAYTSDETGTLEVFIRSFPEPGERTPVSQGGGEFPFWSPDGNTVYYWSLPVPGSADEDTFMAARIRRDPTPVVQRRDALFTGNYIRSAWSLHPDGDLLVVPQPVRLGGDGPDLERERHLVVTNWFEELRQRMGS